MPRWWPDPGPFLLSLLCASADKAGRPSTDPKEVLGGGGLLYLGGEEETGGYNGHAGQLTTARHQLTDGFCVMLDMGWR